ncbi:glycosyltransferase [bacterium]|nr:glycosyltransferase [bacterium]
MHTSTRNKVLVLRLNRLEYVPSGLYSNSLLTEKGYPVVAVEYGFFSKRFESVDGLIPRLRLGHPWLRRWPGVLRTPLMHLLALLRVWRLVLGARPKFILAEGLHEQTLAWALHWLTGIPYGVHVHEVFEAKDVSGWNALFFRLEGPALRRAFFTIFPEATRAHLYRQRYRLSAPQHLVFNCPRRLAQFTPTDWRQRLGLPRDSKLVGYWGGQGRSNALDQGIRAVARHPNVYFLLWGWSSPEDREYFKNLAQGVGAAHRILFLGDLPENKWNALGGLDVSFTLYEPKELRLKHLATASNKFMESLAVGVPVLTSNEPDFRTLVEFYDLGLCASFKVDSLSEALSELLRDEASLQRRRENALRAHREVFNYEYQFRPALRFLDAWLAPEPTADLATSAKT